MQIFVTTYPEKDSLKMKIINSNNKKTHRFDLKDFEGDLLMEVKNLSEGNLERYYTNYIYQGSASNYIVTIQNNSLSSEIIKEKPSFIDEIKFFFISFARYNGCLISA